VIALAALVALGRPLLFTSIDEPAARSRGVPTRIVGVAFLVLLGIAAAGASQVTGSLLVFALLVAPAATAVRLTSRPAAGVCLSVLIAVIVTWLGEAAAYFSPYPIGFWVTTFAFGLFVVASGFRAVRT
jgi:zinc/manganese transport system permease protein